MRTTINVDEHVLAQAKLLAQQSGQTLTAVIEDALRERLARRDAVRQPGGGSHLPVFTGTGPRPGVDLDNSAGLQDVMDDLA